MRQQQVEQAATRKKMMRTVGLAVAGIAAIVLFVWIASNIVGSDDEPTTPTPAVVDTTVAPDTTDG